MANMEHMELWMSTQWQLVGFYVRQAAKTCPNMAPTCPNSPALTWHRPGTYTANFNMGALRWNPLFLIYIFCEMFVFGRVKDLALPYWCTQIKSQSQRDDLVTWGWQAFLVLVPFLSFLSVVWKTVGNHKPNTSNGCHTRYAWIPSPYV